MSAATTTEEAAATSSTPRERGTLKHTLPRRPIFLIGLVWAASATLATMLSLHSLPSVYDTSWQIFFGVASLGSASALVGIVFGDSLSHSLAFGAALLIARYCAGCFHSGGVATIGCGSTGLNSWHTCNHFEFGLGVDVQQHHTSCMLSSPIFNGGIFVNCV